MTGTPPAPATNTTADPAARNAQVARATLIVATTAFIIYVFLGIPDGMLGVAWPSMRQNFGVGQGQMGILLLASTIGFMLTSFAAGRLISWLGIVNLLILACVVRGGGLVGMAFAPDWWTLVAIAFLYGVGSGAIDAGLNTYFAVNLSPRLMNWLHASFGLGATIGPILMTALISSGLVWRWGYALVGIGQALLAILIIVRATDWRVVAHATAADRAGHPALPHRSLASTLARPLVWANIGIFFFVAGVEATAGNWSFTLFTESRGVAVAVAGFWTSFYWASFTLGRFLFGFIADRVNVVNALRLLLGVAVAAGLFLWWNPANWVGFLALAVLGFALAPIFPLLVSSTPQRVGVADATNAVGFQVAAASLGIAILPGVAGILTQRISPVVIPPYMILCTLALIGLYELAVRRAGADPHAPA